MTCTRYANGFLCSTPMREVHRKPVGVKWCFRCRKHLPHDWIVLDAWEPSYYEPVARYDCTQCHEEHVLFPGWVWKDEL